MKRELKVNPVITDDQLYEFYVRNHICEQDFEKSVATSVLTKSSLIIGAFEDGELVGIARAMFDGVAACIMELSLDLRLQGPNLKQSNGSILENDAAGLGREIGEMLLAELWKLGATFVSTYIVDGLEDEFYRSLGFGLNEGHSIYCIDKRPYVR